MKINLIKIFWGILVISFTEILLAEFSSSKDSTSVGSSVTLTWTSNASSCVGENDWTGTKAGSGSESVVIAKTGWNLFTLNCDGNFQYQYVNGTPATSPLSNSSSISSSSNSSTLLNNSVTLNVSVLNDSSGDSVLQIEGANSGDTDGGSATSNKRTIYLYTPDGSSTSPTYSGRVWPYVLTSSDADINLATGISAYVSVNAEGHVLVNDSPAYQYIDDSNSTKLGDTNNGVWYAFRLDGSGTNTESSSVSSSAQNSNLYSKGSIVFDSTYSPFNRYIDVNGLRIFSRDQVTDGFKKNVADAYENIVSKSSSVDSSMQEDFIQSMLDNRVHQRIGFLGRTENYPDDMDAIPEYGDNLTDYIWELVPGRNQIGEVLEHLLHTITNVGFYYYFPNKWNWKNTSSDLYLAMQEAIDKGIYDVSSYEDLRNSDSEGYRKIITQEFAYWLILAEWDYFEFSDRLQEGYSTGNEEFTLGTSEEIQDNLPLAHKLYEDTASKVLNKPNQSLIENLFLNSSSSNSNSSSSSSSSYADSNVEISYALSGPDSSLLKIDDSGKVTFKIAPDYENPLDENKDNIYKITVTGSANGESKSQDISITIRDVVENNSSNSGYSISSGYGSDSSSDSGAYGGFGSLSGAFGSFGDDNSSESSPLGGSSSSLGGSLDDYEEENSEESIQVLIAANDFGSGNVYVIDGVQKKSLTLKVGTTYTFTHSTNHPFRFSNTPDGTHGGGVDYTTGVMTSSGSTVIEITSSTPATLYYYCSIHPGMGGTIAVTDDISSSAESSILNSNSTSISFSTGSSFSIQENSNTGFIVSASYDELISGSSSSSSSDSSDSSSSSDSSDSSASSTSNSNQNSGEYSIPTFEVLDEHPEYSCTSDYFSKYINVFGLYVMSPSEVPISKMIHSAKVLASYIDNDQDGEPDDPKVLDHLLNKNKIIPVWTISTREAFFTSSCFEKNFDANASMYVDVLSSDGEIIFGDGWTLGGLENAKENNQEVNWDTNLEEIWHIVTDGWSGAYPDDFSLDWEIRSTLSEAMDVARGGRFRQTPASYPSDAWYSYYDDTCDYACQAIEYIYWGLMSNFDALSTADHCDNVKDEWKICTAEEFKSKDIKLSALLNDSGYAIPTNIPDGRYRGDASKTHAYFIEVKQVNGANKYFIDYKAGRNLTLIRGNTYYFDFSGNSVSTSDPFRSHPFRLSDVKDGTHGGGQSYIEGVEIVGEPGKEGSYLKFTPSDITPNSLYYYCEVHAGMAGNSVITVKDAPATESSSASSNPVVSSPSSDSSNNASQSSSTDESSNQGNSGLPLNNEPFSASSTNVTVGSSIILSWNSQSNSCSAGGSWLGNKSGSGSEAVTIASSGWNLYTLNCGTSSEYLYIWGS